MWATWYKYYFSSFLLKEKILCFVLSPYFTELCQLLKATCPFSLGVCTEMPGHCVQAPLLSLLPEGGVSELCIFFSFLLCQAGCQELPSPFPWGNALEWWEAGCKLHFSPFLLKEKSQDWAISLHFVIPLHHDAWRSLDHFLLRLKLTIQFFAAFSLASSSP